MLTHYNAKTDLPPDGGADPFFVGRSFSRQSVAGYPGERQLAGSGGGGGGGGGGGERRPPGRGATGPLAPAAPKPAPPTSYTNPVPYRSVPCPALRKISFSGAAPKTKNRGLMAPVCHMLQESVATSTALMVCRRFSASSNTLLLGLSKTSSVTSRIS